MRSHCLKVAHSLLFRKGGFQDLTAEVVVRRLLVLRRTNTVAGARLASLLCSFINDQLLHLLLLFLLQGWGKRSLLLRNRGSCCCRWTMREGLEKQLLELSANLLHGVVRHQQHIFDGQAEDVAGEERGEEQAHGQLVVCEVAIGANKQCVSEVFVCQELLDHRVLSFEERGVHDRIECSLLGSNV